MDSEKPKTLRETVRLRARQILEPVDADSDITKVLEQSVEMLGTYYVRCSGICENEATLDERAGGIHRFQGYLAHLEWGIDIESGYLFCPTCLAKAGE